MSLWKSRKRKDAELSAEIQTHIEFAIQARVERGESPKEARTAILREFGNVALVQEITRETWSWSLIARLAQDLRNGSRMLRRNPGFSIVVILTLALGIGATTAIFSVVYGVVLRPLPFPEAERLVAVWTHTPQVDRLPLAAADHRDIKEQNRVFEDIAILRGNANYNLSGDGGPEWLQGSSIPANLLPLLKVEPALGRNFTPEENQPGRDHEVLLSHSLWQRRYGSDPHIVGKSIRLENVPYTVVGVMGESFHYPTRDIQIWTPLTVNPDDFRTHTGYGHLAVARLRPGATLTQAQNDLTTIAARLSQQYAVKQFISFGIAPLREDIAGSAVKPLVTLLAASIALLLIGCCNLANLLLTRTLTRSRETAVRTALGASHSQLMIQAVAELLPLLLIGAVLGLFAATQSIKLILPLLPATLPRADEISVNLPVMLFCVGLLVVTSALVLVIPLYQMRRSDLVAILHQDSRTSTSKTKIRNSLVVSQVALTVMLLTASGLLIRTFTALKDIDPGFRSSGVISMRLAIPRNKYKEDQKVALFCQRILEQVRALPEVEAAGMGNRLPLSGPSGLSTIEFERSGGQEPGSLPATDDTTITPDYLKAMNIRLVSGRFFTEQDNLNSPLVVILDEQVAQRAWPGEEPIGKRVRSGPSSPWAEVVGVVGHIRHDKLENDDRMQIYWNYWQRARDRMSLVVRTSVDPHSLVSPVLAAIQSIDPDQPAFAVRTLNEVIEQSLSLRWFNTVVVTLFAGSSLLLAVIGLYGVIAWNVKQQTREIGVRIALGAKTSAVLKLVLAMALKITAIGIGFGLVGSYVLGRLLQSLLYDVTKTDPLTFTAVPAILLLSAVAASLLPALRAIRVNPIVALRHE